MLAVALAALAIACGSPPSSPAPSAQNAPATTTSADAPSAAPASAPASASAPAPAPKAAEPPAGETDLQAALDAAKKENKPAFVVFCAKWVAACGELAHVLAESSVRKTLDERFSVARVDVSNDEDPATKERMKRYNVKGLPLMIVFDRKGKEVARETSNVDAQKLSKLLDKAK
jgi:thiol:disulfide interchange protein